MAVTLTGGFVEMLRTISRLRADPLKMSAFKQTDPVDRPGGQTLWTDPVDRPGGQTRWTDPVDRPCGPSTGSVHRVSPTETWWTDPVDRPGGQTRWTDPVDPPQGLWMYGLLFPSSERHRRAHSSSLTSSVVPLTSLSSPPWPEVRPVCPEEERRRHAAVVQKVNSLITNEDYGRLFAVVHFASRQWKVTNEDLILIENHIPAGCGDRIRMEKVLMVGGENFTLIGRPLIGKELVRVEATVIEKTESSPKVYMQFWRRHRFQRKKCELPSGESAALETQTSEPESNSVLLYGM
ncbi:39S ribosomal protein L21, mitochondrial [Merluccius polli]|uniref:Large ribosomal subunit protein bL21m n=1 Tax=Merluccius polli TaxID=89951 RepID=A0AA47NPJ4_MERPO|nr:39S ribosomal protein L21, mitochondrial [Merluccius polli]